MIKRPITIRHAGFAQKVRYPPASAVWSSQFRATEALELVRRYHLLQQRGVSTSAIDRQ
jgi:hypothetical protein